MEVNNKASQSQVEANLNKKIKELYEKEEASMQQIQNLTNAIQTYKTQNSDMKANVASLKQEKKSMQAEAENLQKELESLANENQQQSTIHEQVKVDYDK